MANPDVAMVISSSGLLSQIPELTDRDPYLTIFIPHAILIILAKIGKTMRFYRSAIDSWLWEKYGDKKD